MICPNKRSSGFLLLLLISIFLPACLNAQEAKTYNWFDQAVKTTNTGLFNGVEYIEQHRNINENHKFFLVNDYLKGTLHYDGQPYFDQPLKYNVFDGVLLIRASEGLEESLFQLISEKIDAFEIAGHKFVNIKPGESRKLQGFYEVLLENEEVQLLKEHSKYINKLRDRRFIHYEFKPESRNYRLKFGAEYFEIGSMRDVMRVFPGFKKEIRNFYASERRLRKSSQDNFMISLFKELTPLVQKEKERVL